MERFLTFNTSHNPPNPHLQRHFVLVSARASTTDHFLQEKNLISFSVSKEVELLLQQMSQASSTYVMSCRLYKIMRSPLPDEELLAFRDQLLQVTKTTDKLVMRKRVASFLAGICGNSWIESLDPDNREAADLFADEYERAAIRAFADTGDRWIRDTPKAKRTFEQQVCPDMEGHCMAAYNHKSALVLLDPDAKSLWLAKHPLNMAYGDYCVLVNMCTGEVYTPGRELLNWVGKHTQHYTGSPKVMSLSQLIEGLGIGNNRIHFTRLVNFSSPRFQDFRRRVLGRFSTSFRASEGASQRRSA